MEYKDGLMIFGLILGSAFLAVCWFIVIKGSFEALESEGKEFTDRALAISLISFLSMGPLCVIPIYVMILRAIILSGKGKL